MLTVFAPAHAASAASVAAASKRVVSASTRSTFSTTARRQRPSTSLLKTHRSSNRTTPSRRTRPCSNFSIAPTPPPLTLARRVPSKLTMATLMGQTTTALLWTSPRLRIRSSKPSPAALPVKATSDRRSRATLPDPTSNLRLLLLGRLP